MSIAVLEPGPHHKHYAERIAYAAAEAVAKGSTLSAQPQVNFLTGALARVIKDWAIVEHLQKFQTVNGK